MKAASPAAPDPEDACAEDDFSSLRAALASVAEDLKADRYRAGGWQRFVERARRAPAPVRVALAPQISAVSQLLHARRGIRRVPLGLFSALECLGLVAGLVALGVGLGSDRLVLVWIAVGLLGVTLQPLLKASVGLLLGVRFAYGYVVNGEPRYKLDFGRYLAVSPARRVAFHLSGTLGTATGLLIVAAASMATHPRLGQGLCVAALVLVAVQWAAFGAVLGGLRRLPGIGRLSASSAGAAADELRSLRQATR